MKGVGGRELPINGSVFLVSITFPGLHLVGEGLQVRNAAVQALSGKDAQFDLGDIEPAAVPWAVVQFEALG